MILVTLPFFLLLFYSFQTRMNVNLVMEGALNDVSTPKEASNALVTKVTHWSVEISVKVCAGIYILRDITLLSSPNSGRFFRSFL